MNLIEPTVDYVERRLRQSKDDDRFYGERAVGLVFQQWPTNTNYDQVLVKSVVLNRLYSTSIYDLRTMAQHILDLGIDERLCQGDSSLI